jgi:putative transposase
MVALSELSDAQRDQALGRYAVLRPHLERGVSLARAARAAGVPERTARRWLARFRADGLAGLARAGRADRGRRRTPVELVELIEGLALRRPRPSIAHVHRQVAGLAAERGFSAPSYATTRAIVAALDHGLVALAHEGPAAYRDGFELALRREAAARNAIWQADHTQLDLLILDHAGRPVRPWLTVILDDFSRAIAGYAVFLDAPSALQTALALRHAIWRKADPAWPVCGVPDVLYTDHGSDFTSRHLEQVAADLHLRLVFSTAGVPQGRGKIERFFGTVTTELLPTLPGYLAPNRAGADPPRLTLSDLDAAVDRFITATYHQRRHSETRQPPVERWTAGGWIPRLPDSLEQLDVLLLTVARARTVHRDGIRFQGLRYLDLTLAAYVGEPVTIRYDPRDLAEVRVFHAGRFLCRAISPELAGQTISLRDLQAARTARRRALRTQLRERRSLADDLVPQLTAGSPAPTPEPSRQRPVGSRLRRYRED